MAKGTSGGGARGGLSRPVTPSADLAAITGSDPLPRSQVVSKMWDYIRTNKLQNPENKREILADDKLQEDLRHRPLLDVRDEQASLAPSELEPFRSGGEQDRPRPETGGADLVSWNVSPAKAGVHAEVQHGRQPSLA